LVVSRVSLLSLRMYYKVIPGRGIGPGHRDLSRVRMPRYSHGQCKHSDCTVVDDLANSLCQKHWDMTLDRQDEKKVGNVRETAD